jgi:hypothetical protein
MKLEGPFWSAEKPPYSKEELRIVESDWSIRFLTKVITRFYSLLYEYILFIYFLVNSKLFLNNLEWRAGYEWWNEMDAEATALCATI